MGSFALNRKSLQKNHPSKIFSFITLIENLNWKPCRFKGSSKLGVTIVFAFKVYLFAHFHQAGMDAGANFFFKGILFVRIG